MLVAGNKQAYAAESDSEARVDRLALQGEDREGAFVDAVERLSPGEPLQALDAEPELAHGERALAAEVARAQPLELAGVEVLGAVDDPQVLGPAALDPRLGDPLPTWGDELERLHHHPLPAGRGQLLPPADGGGEGLGVVEVDEAAVGAPEPVRVGLDQAVAEPEVPGVVAVDEDGALGGEDVERGQAQVLDRGDRPDVAAVGVGVALDVPAAAALGLEQAGDVEAARRALLQGGDRGVETGAGGGADARVLAADQLAGLRRPGQQLAVEQQPAGVELVPEPGRLGGAAD